MSTDLPYPSGVNDRFRRLEEGRERNQAAIAALNATTAVHTEQIVDLQRDLVDHKSDVKEDLGEIKRSVSKMVAGLWAVALVGIPIAVSLIVMVARGASLG